MVVSAAVRRVAPCRRPAPPSTASDEPPRLSACVCSGHCKSLTPEYKKAASALKGIAKVVAVDGTENQAIAQKLGVKVSRAPARSG